MDSQLIDGHPAATPERILAILAAVAGFPRGAGGLTLHFHEYRNPDGNSDERDRYGRLVDALDAMAWIEGREQIELQVFGEGVNAYETWTLGPLEVFGPRGITPLSDKFALQEATSTLERLAGKATPAGAEPVAPTSIVDRSERARRLLHLVPSGDDVA